jgi:predicted nucleic acid-binding protein
MSWLCDTSVLVDVLREDQRAISWFVSGTSKPAVSVASLAELYAGARSRHQESDIERLAASLTLYPVSRAIAIAASGFLKHYRSSHGVEIADALIAATAEHHGLGLATLNVKHFPMFEKLKAPY